MSGFPRILSTSVGIGQLPKQSGVTFNFSSEKSGHPLAWHFSEKFFDHSAIARRPILTIYTSYGVFPHKDVPFGDPIFATHSPQNPNLVWRE